VCDDADVCTAESCDEIQGCVNDPMPGCEIAAVPSASPAGRVLLGLLVFTAGALLLAQRRGELWSARAPRRSSR
jgi:hypothetical protein